jgi:hypothetical protein
MYRNRLVFFVFTFLTMRIYLRPPPRNGFEWVMALHMSDQTPEAAQFQLAENFLRKSRSTLWIATSLASQRRAALAAISANTRCRFAGELEITRNISAVAAC